MNQHLQTILNFIQQSEHVSDEEKAALLKSAKDANKELEITSFKLDRTEKVKRTTAILLEETIEELEQKRKAVEAQNKELEVEAALERVRAIAMGMNKADDMLDVCKTISQQLELLNVKEIRNVQTAIFYKEKGTYTNYEYYTKHDKTLITETTYNNNEKHAEFAENMQKGNGQFFEMNINGDDVKDWIAYQKTTNVFIDDFLYDASSLNYYWHSLGPVALGISTYQPLKEEDKILFNRFLKVFELAYRRYLDIEKAEAQAKEARIEAALEKVRSRSLAVHKSDEFNEVVTIVFEKLQELDINASSVSINIFIEGSKDTEVYICGPNESGLVVSHFLLFYFDNPISNDRFNAQESGLNFFTKTYGLEEKNSFYEYEFEVSGLKNLPADIKKIVFESKRYTISLALAKHSMIVVNDFEGKTLSEKEIDIVKRFSRVFEQAYTRFLDLQKAETQAREGQIEAALERVRSRSMGMQKSDELKEVIQIVYEQFVHLNINVEHTGFIMDYRERNDMHIWLADKHAVPFQITIPYFDSPHWNSFNEAKAAGKDFFINHLSFEEKNKFYQDLFKLFPVPDDAKEYYFNCPGLAISTVLLDNVGLYIENFSGIPYSDEDNKTLMRFGKVFQQTYTRFNDLKKAEAQAREAQIEAALEKVRSRSLAMHKSDELQDVVNTVFDRLKALKIDMNVASIFIFTEDSKDWEQWVASSDTNYSTHFHLPYTDNAIFRDLEEAKQSGKNFYSVQYSNEEKNKWFSYAFANTEYSRIPDNRKQFLLESEFYQVSFALSKHIGLQLAKYSGEDFSENNNEILIRFAKVFEQAYVRFLDLEKAEAQAREAQIELSLERVRAKTMAMHNSADVGETAAVMVEELKKLDIETIRCGIGIMHEPGDMEVWTISTDENNKTDIIIGWLDMNMHPLLHGAFESWRNKIDTYAYELINDDLLNYYKAINNYPGYPIRYNTSDLPKQIHHNEFHFAEGTLFAFSLQQLTDEQRKIFKRFAGVFGQTYRRYLDLKRAEAQAKEAQIEAALERVRSRTLAMQKSDELAETSAVLFQQLISLGISPNRLYISIMKDDVGNTEFWITDEDGSKVSMAYEDNLNNNPSFKKMYDGWKQQTRLTDGQEKSLVIDMKGTELKEYLHYLGSIHVPFKGGLAQKRRLQYLAYFNRGFIGMAAPDEQPEETLQLLERFAYVFNLTFTRFNDLQIAEAHALQAEHDLIEIKAARKKAEETLVELQSTQKQLVQSEKMASLGELTAGIAHEIQNPLNFVNNFSEVSKELLDEMKAALEHGDKEEADAIANDIIQNLEKINHHGKRADAIVKGMLQHSRKSSGQKEPTDINALCDEYVRLCYHGLRAKDKSFNANINTDFDNSIKKINLIPQDISRVMLNILTNAFYAVNEKSQQSTVNSVQPLSDEYKPIVSVSTKNLNDKIEIKVSDNGNGIPLNIIDKIFQPFFTTKPTGQGTGLGLSLAYDIITKEHNGTIKVESKEGEGTTFIITVPA